MKIKVKQEHIEKGMRHSPVNCPLALAISEQVKQPCQVFCHSVMFVHDNHRIPSLPGEAQDFICNFDRYYPVEPFEFELDV